MADPVNAKDFFTLASMLTLTGASGMTYVACNALQRAFNFNPRWLGLAVAEAICLWGIYSHKDTVPSDYFIGVFDGFLVYLTALGGITVSGKEQPVAMGRDAQIPRRGFFTRWI